MLINCSECVKEISDKATACPHCGCPIEKGESIEILNGNEFFMFSEYMTDNYTIKTNSELCNKELKLANADLKQIENEKKKPSKLTWLVLVDAIIIVLGTWWLITDLEAVAIEIILPFILAVIVVSAVLYLYVISDDKPTAKEIKENGDKMKYNNYRYTCPVCGSRKVKKISDLNRASSVAMMGLASSKIGKQYECDKCHHKW